MCIQTSSSCPPQTRLAPVGAPVFAPVLAAMACVVFLAGLVVPITSADAATLWRKRGANGEWVYYDRPMAGAEPYEMAVYGPATGKPVPAATGAAARSGGAATARVAAGGPPSRVEVLFPADAAVIQFQDVAHLVARVRVEPALNGGQKLWWAVNGQWFEGAGAETALRALPRGAHTLQARVSDAAGKPLLDSKAVTFTIRQAVAITPPVGPALRKPTAP